METILSPFVKRFSQPIILSFVLAWIFWNWEIVIALIWYNQETMNKLPGKKTNYIEYINSLKDPWKLYYGPLISSLAYPFVVLIANNFNALIKRADTWLFFWISRKGSVSTDLYLKAQDDIEEKEKRISRFINKESEMNGQINDLTISKNELTLSSAAVKNENVELNSNLSSLRSKYETLEIDHDLIFRFSQLNWLEGEGGVEIIEDDLTKISREILYGTFNLTNNDGNFNITIQNNYGEVSFSISNPMFNPVTRYLRINFNKIDDSIRSDKKHDTQNILFILILSNINRHSLLFKVAGDNNTLKTIIQSGEKKYEFTLIPFANL